MTRLLIAVVLAAVVSFVAWFVDRRRTSHPIAVRRGALPTQVPAAEVGLDSGPAIIEQADTTIVVLPDMAFRVDAYGQIILQTGEIHA